MLPSRLARRPVTFFLAGLAALALGACQGMPAGSTGGATPAPAIKLLDVEWQLVALQGRPAEMGNGDKPATLVLATAESRASGFAGCNRFTGRYEPLPSGAQGELRFGMLASTRMACLKGDQLETRYTGALTTVSSYRASAASLELLDSKGVVVAAFKRP